MKTRRSLRPHQPLLVGRLEILERALPPCLGINVWCPFCKHEHNHGWIAEEKFNSAHVDHRQAHCSPESPFWHGGYWVGPDPAAKAENKATFERFKAYRAAWDARRRRVSA